MRRPWSRAIDGQFGLRAEQHRLQIGCAGVFACTARFNVAPDTSPHVGFVREVDGQLIVDERVGSHAPLNGRLVARHARSRAEHARRHGGKKAGAGGAHGRAGGAEFRFRLMNALIRDADLLLQCIQRRIAERFPPLPSLNVVARLCRLPLRRERAPLNRKLLEC
jgi:hypothetical protein